MAKTIIHFNAYSKEYPNQTLELPHTDTERYIIKFEDSFVVIQHQVFQKASKLTDIQGKKAQPESEWVTKSITFVNSSHIDRIILDNELEIK